MRRNARAGPPAEPDRRSCSQVACERLSSEQQGAPASFPSPALAAALGRRKLLKHADQVRRRAACACFSFRLHSLLTRLPHPRKCACSLPARLGSCCGCAPRTCRSRRRRRRRCGGRGRFDSWALTPLQEVYRLLISALRRLSDPGNHPAFSRAAALLSTLTKARGGRNPGRALLSRPSKSAPPLHPRTPGQGLPAHDGP